MTSETGPLRAMAIGLALVSTLAVGVHVWPGGQEAARAQQPLIVGFDMNTAGNECPADGTDCSIGPVDACVAVNPGDNLQFDVFLQGLPEGENFSGADFKIMWGPPDWLDITERTHTLASVNLLVQMQGSAPVDLSPQELPVVSSPYITSIIDFALPVGRYDEANPPYTQGVLGRYSGQVASDAEPGIYTLTFDPTFLAVYRATPDNLCEAYGCEMLDGNHAPQYGLVAVGQDCPAGPTTPEPSAQGTAAATAVATATPAAPTASPPATRTPVRAVTATPGPASASTPGAVPSDNDGTDWGSAPIIAVYLAAGFVAGLAVAGITYLGTRGRRA